MRYTANERRVLALTGGTHFAAHFFELMFPTLAVALARETGTPLAEVLGWSFAGYLLFGLGALPAGMLTDRIGGKRVLVTGLFGMGAAALAAGFASPGPSLAWLLAVIGLCASAYHPAGMSLISHTMRARGRGLGLNGIFGNLGVATTPMLTALLAGRLGWQRAYVTVGAVACVVAVVYASIPIDDRPAAPAHAAGDGAPVGVDVFALLCLAAALGGVSYRANTVAQPAYFDARVTLLGYGAVTSVVYLIGIAGQYLGGVLADRHDLRWLYLGFHAASLPALWLVARTSELALVGSATLFIFFSLGMQPIENSLFARFTPPRWRATGYGIKFVMTFGVGSLAVRLVQWAEAGGDLSAVFRWLLLVIAVLVASVALIIRRTAGRTMRNVVPEAGLAA
ncbi:MAG TPA: MFS transporter [Candidatus Binatia bacterium]|nr:MFS transporter [Candidatus Binatia bacterium]